MKRDVFVLAVLLFGIATMVRAEFVARDPGVRGGDPGVGDQIPGLTPSEQAFFLAGEEAFQEVVSVQGKIPNTDSGLGPRFNMDSCGGCHKQPAIGGSSPFLNPQVEVATKDGARNLVPFFITPDGPVREARFRFKFKRKITRDGGVHNLYTITHRVDAPDCVLSQPDFEHEARRDNVIFRIPTPVFGAGLIEAIPDATILKNKMSHLSQKRELGISGHPNTNGNDGTIARFGWKAQNKSLELFAGEAYNVEQGVTNELFPTERDETSACLYNEIPEDHTNLDALTPINTFSDPVKFAFFMRLLAPPRPAPETKSIARGRMLFTEVGCALCHTPSLTTGPSSSGALRGKQVPLFSDLLVHGMGPRLADDIIQGSAGPDEFRTAPLWGLGQRIFFLHDGQTKDLLEAIKAHASVEDDRFPSSEANTVISSFNALMESQKQDMLNFLRSL